MRLLLIFLLIAFSLSTHAFGYEEGDWGLRNVGESIQNEILGDKDAPVIFSDQNFSQPERNFSPNQMVYVRVSAGSGDKQKTLRLLDDKKKEIRKITFSQSGNIYTASFPAPAGTGIYYVDIKIEGEGSSYAHQENLTVGEVQGGSVTAEAESQVITGGQDQSYQLEVLGTPGPAMVASPVATGQFIPSQTTTVISQILEFFKNLLARLKFW